MYSGQFLAILSAALFGISPVLCKLVIGDMSPALLAGLLYLGSGNRDVVGPVSLNVYFAGCTRSDVSSFLAISPILISPLTISASK